MTDKTLAKETPGEYFFWMENSWIIERYGVYYDYIERMEDSELFPNPKLKNLKLTKAHLNRAYKEINVIGFKGSLVEYLSWIAVEFRLYVLTKTVDIVSKELDDEVDYLFEYNFLRKAINAMGIKLTESPRFQDLKTGWEHEYNDNKSDDEFVRVFNIALARVIFS